MASTREIGNRGERLAGIYLRSKGYVVLEHQYRYRRGDVDLICRDDETLVFVEVKTRRNRGWCCPEDAVTAQKQRRIVRLARAYLYERNLTDRPCRFDVVTVILRPNRPPGIEHFKDAFWA